MDIQIERQVDDMLGALTDPIIVWPGGWADTLPQNMKGDIQVHRLAQLAKGEQGLVTWPEVCAYLYTVTLERPVGSEWVRIYQYALTQYKGDAVPDDLRVEELGRDETRMLTELRTFIWRSRVKAREERARAERRKAREHVAARAPKQLSLGIQEGGPVITGPPFCY